MKNALLVSTVLVLVGAVGVFGWVHATFTGDAVRTSMAAQVARAVGQPVSIGSIALAFRPRPALRLNDIRIGAGTEIAIARIDIAAAPRALLSRRIEDASVHVAGARVTLPLPAFSRGTTAPGAERLRFVSVRDVVVSNLVIVGGDRTLTGDADVVPDGPGLTIRRLRLSGDGTALEVTGRIAELAGPAGQLTVRASSLHLLDLVAIAGVLGRGPSRPQAEAGAMALDISIDAERAQAGPLAFEALSTQARLTPATMTLDQASFTSLGGRGQGSLVVSRSETPVYRLHASLEGADMAAAADLAGRSGAITGRLSATVDVEGQATSADAALQTARGTARAETVNGTIRGLDVVQTINALTATRLDSVAGATTTPDGYQHLGLSMDIGNGQARTSDFRLESSAVRFTAAGTIALDGGAVRLAGRALLSNGMTVPASVTGSVTDPRMQLDGGAAMRALTSLDAEAAVQGILGGLRDLFSRKPQ